MSDLYDSLEDDSDGHEYSRDLLNHSQNESSESFQETYKCDSLDKYSFFLNPVKYPQKPNLDRLFFFNEQPPDAEEIFPEIQNDNRAEGLTPHLSNFVVDKTALNEKGLQLNKDGSFTRSPRPEEELPFITREYRNLKFQKKKTYLMSGSKHSGRNTSAEKLNKRLVEGLTEGTKENLTFKPTETSSRQFKPNNNMTDSMKERLLKNYEENKRVVKNQETTRPEQKKKFPNTRNSENFSTREEKEFERKRGFPSVKNFFPNISATAKPRLNYSERYQLESGFNPMSLRQKEKKVPEDSDRSNFGDSVQQDLPEISSRVISYDDLHNLEEEMFYEKIIQKEKALRGTPRTCRSDGPVERLKLDGITGRNSCKEHTELITRKNSRSKRDTKSTFIDMPAEFNHSKSNTRFSHYCSSNPSTNASKVELAIKAKTYGYLVNARNIFRLKAQSERKFNSGKEKNKKTNEDINSHTDFLRILSKQNSLPTNCFTKVGTPLVRNSSKQNASLSQPKLKTIEVAQREFVLPQVTSSELNNRKVTPEIFEKISSCLKND